MGKIVVFGNRKGGVGKTSSIILLADYLASIGKKVIVYDLDEQRSLSSMYAMASKKKEVKWGAIKPYDENGNRSTQARVMASIAHNRDEYDFVLIDVPGSIRIGDEHHKIIAAAHYLFIPVCPSNMDVASMQSYLVPVVNISYNKDARERKFRYYGYVNRYRKRQTMSVAVRKAICKAMGEYGSKLYHQLGEFTAVEQLLPGTNLHLKKSTAGQAVKVWVEQVANIITDV